MARNWKEYRPKGLSVKQSQMKRIKATNEQNKYKQEFVNSTQDLSHTLNSDVRHICPKTGEVLKVEVLPEYSKVAYNKWTSSGVKIKRDFQTEEIETKRQLKEEVDVMVKNMFLSR